jgi:hypothetical protein
MLFLKTYFVKIEIDVINFVDCVDNFCRDF